MSKSLRQAKKESALLFFLLGGPGEKEWAEYILLLARRIQDTNAMVGREEERSRFSIFFSFAWRERWRDDRRKKVSSFWPEYVLLDKGRRGGGGGRFSFTTTTNTPRPNRYFCEARTAPGKGGGEKSGRSKRGGGGRMDRIMLSSAQQEDTRSRRGGGEKNSGLMTRKKKSGKRVHLCWQMNLSLRRGNGNGPASQNSLRPESRGRRRKHWRDANPYLESIRRLRGRKRRRKRSSLQYGLSLALAAGRRGGGGEKKGKGTAHAAKNYPSHRSGRQGLLPNPLPSIEGGEKGRRRSLLLLFAILPSALIYWRQRRRGRKKRTGAVCCSGISLSHSLPRRGGDGGSSFLVWPRSDLFFKPKRSKKRKKGGRLLFSDCKCQSLHREDREGGT